MSKSDVVVVIDDPALGCIPSDVHACLLEHDVESHLVSVADFIALPDTARRARVIVVGVSVRFDANLLDSLPNVRALVSAVIGVDAIDAVAAARRAIQVSNSAADEASESLAEATILLILACLYDLNRAQRLLALNAPRPPRPSAVMLKGRTVGLVGFGKTAQHVAKRLANWNVRILAYARTRPDTFSGVDFVSLRDLMVESDVISIHASLNPATEGLVSRERLQMTKPGVVIINTARGKIVDEDALVELCESGHIAAIGFDVFAREPLPMESPVRAVPRAILTPHRLGHTVESFDALVRATVGNVFDALRKGVSV
ncbi:MAG: hypothetical protein EPN73_01940 [Paraburkholderia sp.]|uniref:NAD(P)-dependent oxidoreductase n=1 Tax=Paraburkholderia sp. TaxID=1926495 RepID=UPI0011F6ADD5|nr:NAD(P)-dependent oxidoreductase [Paraburkholderia sp.]TAL98704.1 MAG: hypothetical protein EPN73_01940 [Paraburkholderia sp.]